MTVSVLGVGRCVTDGVPAAAILERRSRHRSSPFTRTLAEAFGDALVQAQEHATIDPAEIGVVVGSALGEITTMLDLLGQMWRGDDMSPMAFAMSVHNAAAGVLSISTKNRRFATSIAADADTVAMSLFEAAAWVLAEGRPVGVVVGEDAAPDGLVGKADAFERLAGALVLAPAGTTGARATLSLPYPGPPIPAAARPGLDTNPQVGILDLLDAIEAGGEREVSLSRTETPWRVRVTA